MNTTKDGDCEMSQDIKLAETYIKSLMTENERIAWDHASPLTKIQMFPDCLAKVAPFRAGYNAGFIDGQKDAADTFKNYVLMLLDTKKKDYPNDDNPFSTVAGWLKRVLN